MVDLYIYNTNNGVIVPDTEEILAQVNAEWTAAFGLGFDTTPSTPQGILIAAEVAARTAVINNNAAIANQINPNIAGGVFLDAIGALNGVEREPSTRTIVIVNLTGVQGTVIPVDSVVTTPAGDLFTLQATQTLNGSGLATGTFQSVTLGAIPAPIGSLGTIVDGVAGWETANNPVAGVLGNSIPTDQAYHTFRNDSLAWQGTSLSEAIQAAIVAVPGVQFKPFYVENKESTIQVIEGVTMVPNSIYVCAVGGSDEDIATAIITRKSGGCNFTNGASGDPRSYAYTDPNSGQVTDVLFDRPDLIQILVQVTVQTNSAVTNPQDAVTQAILDYMNGLINGKPGWAIGTDVSSFELAIAIGQEVPALFVELVQTKISSDPDFSSANILIGPWQQAQTNPGNITVILDGLAFNFIEGAWRRAG